MDCFHQSASIVSTLASSKLMKWYLILYVCNIYSQSASNVGTLASCELMQWTAYGSKVVQYYGEPVDSWSVSTVSDIKAVIGMTKFLTRVDERRSQTPSKLSVIMHSLTAYMLIIFTGHV